MRVIIESPYAATQNFTVAGHLLYAKMAVLDSLERGEWPFASHLFYAQVLDDDAEDQRRLGFAAAFRWMERADLVAVYQDLGISAGMKAGIEHAQSIGLQVVHRTFGGGVRAIELRDRLLANIK